MKPLKLEMHYFGPYENTTVDFTKFDDAPLYLIAGNTGSGKTTIFDAMCVALYGNSSSDRRSAEMFRSDFATSEQTTEVTFWFEHEGVVYRLYRRPKQILKKARGKGTTEAKHQASLIYPVGAAKPHELTKLKDVEDFIGNLLGVSVDQFRQLIILPQGEVQKFLMAPSRDKETIMTTLFQTQLYTDWVGELDNLVRQKKEQTQDTSSRLKALLGQVEGVSDQLEVDQWLVAVADLLKTNQAGRQTVNQKLGQAQEKAAKLQQRRQDEEELSRNHDALVSCETQQKQLDEEGPAIERLAAENEETTWAQSHQTSYHEWQRETAELTDLNEQAEQCQKDRASAQAKVAQLEAEATELAKAAPAIQERQRQLANLKDRRPLFERVTQLEGQLATGRQELEEKTADLANQTQALAKLRAEKERLKKADQGALDLAQEEVAVATRTQQLAQWQKKRADLVHQAAELTNQAGRLQDLTAKIKDAEQTVAARTAELKEKKKSRLAAMITALANELAEGEPCPVCGSTTHPHVAAITDASGEVTEEELDAAQDAVTAAEADRAKLISQEDSLSEQVQKGRHEFTAQLAELSRGVGLSAADLTQLAEAIDQEEETLAARQNKLEQARLAADRRQAQLADLEEREQTDQVILSKLQQAKAALELAVSQSETELTSKREQLPADLPDLDSAKRRINQEQAAVDDFLKRQEASQGKLSQARTRLTELTTTLTQLTANKQATATTIARLKGELDAVLAERQASWELFEVALKRVPDLARRQQTVNEHRQQVQSLADQHERLIKQIADRPVPDLTQTKTELQEAQQQVSELQRTLGEQDSALKQIKNTRQRVVDIDQKQGEVQRQLRELTSLCDLLKGKGENHMGLQRYVQRHYFTEVLQVGNQWLAKLTNHRYRMILDQKDNFGRSQSHNGLEIYVEDDYAGKARMVQTLSGGESFMTALALALALGEVVQRHHGGVKIEALFVDEGFGSLDQEALGDALAALQGLEGNRMIGIISHVTELEEQIPDQLQVIAENGRSRVSYQLEQDQFPGK